MTAAAGLEKKIVKPRIFHLPSPSIQPRPAFVL